MLLANSQSDDAGSNLLWQLGKIDYPEFEKDRTRSWNQVRLKCMECHLQEDLGELGLALGNDNVVSKTKPTYTGFWLKHARFDHRKHLAWHRL